MELANEREEWQAGEDLFEKLGGSGSGSGKKKDGTGEAQGGFYEGPEACREYLGERAS